VCTWPGESVCIHKNWWLGQGGLVVPECLFVDCVPALHKSQSMRERTGGHVAGHMHSNFTKTHQVQYVSVSSKVPGRLELD